MVAPLPGKSVLITGCSSGSIGEALAKEFLLHEGNFVNPWIRKIAYCLVAIRRTDIFFDISEFTVCATSLPGEQLTELEALGALCFPVDVTSTKSVDVLRDAVVDRLGEKLDVLINCAYVLILHPSNLQRACIQLHHDFERPS